MANQDRILKVKHDKFYTRAKSERLLTAGADPQETFADAKGTKQHRFMDHPNYHVRARAWTKMGKPLPEDLEERNKFLKSLRLYKEPVEVAEVEADDGHTRIGVG